MMVLLFGLGWYSTIKTTIERPVRYREYLRRAEQLETKEIYYDAVLEYQKALEYKPNNQDIYLKMAEDYLMLGENQKFESTCKSAIALGGENEEVIFRLADYYIEKGENREAISLLRRQAQNKKDNSAIMAKLRSLAGGYDFVGTEYEMISDCMSDYMLVSSGGQMGLINGAGNVVIRPQYEYISLFGTNGFAPVSKDGHLYYIDTSNYKRREPEETYEYLGICNQGKIPACKDGRWGYLNENFSPATEFDYEEATPFLNGLAALKMGGKWAIINSDMNKVTEFEFDDVIRDDWGFCSRNGVVFARSGESYILVNEKGAEIAGGFEDARPFVSGGAAAVKQGGKWGFLSKDGSMKLEFVFQEAKSFSDIGYAPVREDTLWGYIKENGEFVIEPTFSDAKSFNTKGIAPVKSGGTWQLIILDIYE